MIFTIGHQENYLKAIARHGAIYKVGRREPCDEFPNGYAGGYAFASIEDAQKRIGEAYEGRGMAVFGLLADWERDTVPSPDGWWHNLVIDALIVVVVCE